MNLPTIVYCRGLIKEAKKQRRISHSQPQHNAELEPEHEAYPDQEHDPESEPEDGQDVDTEPEPMPERKRQKRQHQSPSVQPRIKRAPRRTTKKNIQFRHDNVEESVSEHTDLTLIRTRSWSGLLRHRMAPGGFLSLVERLQYEQWLAIVDAGFGGILSVRTKLIPKSLARWLLEKYDPWDNSLNLANGKLLIDEEDVYATLGLPMGEFEINEGQTSDGDIQFLDHWRRRWHVERGGPPIGSMDEVILSRGGHGHDFVTDFITYAITTCIVGNANGTCHFRVVKYLRKIDEIKHYNWCAYTIKCLNDAVIEWKKDKTKFFTGSLLFLMVSTTISHYINI